MREEPLRCRFTGWLLSVMLGGALVAAQPVRAVPAPQAPASSTGAYSVSYAPCGNCYLDWLEERAGSSGTWEMVGQGAASFSNKPPGTYHYRVGYFFFDYSSLSNWTEYSAPISVVVGGQAPDRRTLPQQLSDRYLTRVGDIDADGRRDLFVERTSGGSAGDGTLDAVVLRRASNALFSPIVPSASQAATAHTWPVADVGLDLRDINIDGFADILLTNLSSMPGFGRALDQIVFAPGPSRLEPKGLRAVDADLARFGSDVRGYLQDRDYFADKAPIAYVVVAYYYYDSACYYGYGSVESYGFPCYPVVVYHTVAYKDYSVFSPSAVSVWDSESAMKSQQISPGSAYDRIDSELEGLLRVGVGGWNLGELLGTRDDDLDGDARRGTELFAVLAGISSANAQGVPERTTADDVLLTGRRIIGFGPFHTALEYSGQTISGHDSDDRSLFDGTLISEVNWPNDHPALTLKLATVSSSLSPSLYWARLLSADANYDDGLRYDAVPSIGYGGYNSNSYTSGIVGFTNGVPGVPMTSFIGGERPVPPSEYN